MLYGKYVCGIAFGEKGNVGYRGTFLTSMQKSIIDLQQANPVYAIETDSNKQGERKDDGKKSAVISREEEQGLTEVSEN